MDYIRITLQLTPDIQDFRDLLMATLGEIGFESFRDKNIINHFFNIEMIVGDASSIRTRHKTKSQCVEFELCKQQTKEQMGSCNL